MDPEPYIAQALSEAERIELDRLLAGVLLPTFTEREREIARIAARAALTAATAAQEAELQQLEVELSQFQRINEQAQEAFDRSLTRALDAEAQLTAPEAEQARTDESTVAHDAPSSVSNRLAPNGRDSGHPDAANALHVWTELSVLVACSSPDGSAELEQVRYAYERADAAEARLTAQEAEIARLSRECAEAQQRLAAHINLNAVVVAALRVTVPCVQDHETDANIRLVQRALDAALGASHD